MSKRRTPASLKNLFKQNITRKNTEPNLNHLKHATQEITNAWDAIFQAKNRRAARKQAAIIKRQAENLDSLATWFRLEIDNHLHRIEDERRNEYLPEM